MPSHNTCDHGFVNSRRSPGDSVIGVSTPEKGKAKVPVGVDVALQERKPVFPCH